MRSIVAIAFVMLGAGCGAGQMAKSQDALRKQAVGDLACGAAEAKVVYYGTRGADIQAASACFGPTADKLAVVECGEKRRAYWGFADRWEIRPGEVTRVEADGIELTLPGAENESGSVSAVARCGR